MTKLRFTLQTLALSLLMLALASLAQAQATRTWVSGVGDDVNPCSRTAPCKTWAGAISKTAAGGEIDTLDPGGYGTLTISKSILVDGTSGAGWGSALNSGGINGFVIYDNATALPNSVRMTLRNLSINGAGREVSQLTVTLTFDSMRVFLTPSGPRYDLKREGNEVGLVEAHTISMRYGSVVDNLRVYYSPVLNLDWVRKFRAPSSPAAEILPVRVALSPDGRNVAISPDGKTMISRLPDGTSIAYLITTWEKAGDLRRGTETAYANGDISSDDYGIRIWDITRLEELTVRRSLIYFAGHGLTAEAWQSLPELTSAYSPSSTPASSFSARWIEMYRKRVLLEMDLAREIINEAEYNERKQSLLNQEQDLAKKYPLSESEMIAYYEHVSRLPAEIARLKESLNTRPSLIVVLAPWGTASVALLAAILGFILSLRKDSRERKEMEFKELQAKETAARISQIEQSRDMQLEELKLKIRQLEQQLSTKESKLIIPA